MRFFISSNIKGNRPLYITVVFFLISAALYWVGSWLYYHSKFGLTYKKMFSYFFTDPQFPERLPLAQLLEDVHIQLFMLLTFLLVLASLFIHRCMRDNVKYTLISLSFLFGLLDILSGFLVYYLGSLFIYLKIASFVVYQISSGTMLALALKLYLTEEKEEPPERSILYTIVFVFTVSTFIFTAVNFFLFYEKFGLTPDSVARYYLGDPQRFVRPKTLAGIIDIANPHFLAMAVYLFALVHFAFFTNVKRKATLSALLLSSALIDNVSGILIRFIHPLFAYVKLISFFSLTLLMLYLSAVILVSILRHRAKAIVLL